mmetsp:Transcript_16491/g.35637  ORF Transcript_16491/g.35637 Transcript_16491/m.35637 type:complete len:453 (-) Transcript_16491:138-1496(-)
MSSVDFIIGNTYSKIRQSNAKWDSTRTQRRIHDWTLYVDILGSEADADLVKKVEFNMGSKFTPSKFVSWCPIKVSGGGGGGRGRWRFQTRQQMYGDMKVKIAIVGRGGTVLRRDFRVGLFPGGLDNGVDTFKEHKPYKQLIPVPMAEKDFGIELELSTSSGISSSDVANAIREKASVVIQDMTNDYVGARSRTDIWVLMYDASLVCSRSDPNCNRFELVSPILKGRDGLGIVDRVINALGKISSTINVNQSMGFHVHVNVDKMPLPELKKVCQNFVKYEEAIDSVMPPSRRRVNEFCKSNRLAVAGEGASNKEIHDSLASCNSLEKLGTLMSPNRYHKFNMVPLVTGRQPTIEFRQHSGTYQKEKVKNWIRFCVAFVHNSAKFRAPSHASYSVGNDELFEMLMMYTVKDRFLRDFYRQRRVDVVRHSKHCCDGCGSGGGCDANSRPLKMPRR